MEKRSEFLQSPLKFFSQGSKKRGISAIIATVLIILITVVAVTIIWVAIIPMIGEVSYLSYSDVKLNIVMGGYTVYDPEKHFAFVQVERGQDEVNVTRLEIGFNFNGTTKTYQTLKVPEPGGKQTYKFNFTNDSIEGVPGKVSVAPIFIFKGKIKLGDVLDSEDMPSGKVYLTEDEWESANNDSGDNIIIRNGKDEPEDDDCNEGEVVYGEGCAIDVNALSGGAPYNLNQEGRTYVLTDDIVVTGDGITIAADGITLDGDGWNLTGSGNSIGIFASGYDNLVVKDFGNIGNFERGVHFESVSNSVIEDNTMVSEVAQTTYSVYLEDGDSNNVENNNIDWSTSSGASYGVYLYVDSGSFGSNNIIGNNLSIYSESSSGYVVYLRNYGTSNSNTIQSNTIDVTSSSSGYGVSLDNHGTSNSNTIQSNTIDVDSSSYGYGINLHGRGTLMDSNTIQSNTIDVDSSLSGFGVNLVNQGTLMDSNTIQSNTIDVDSSPGFGVRLYGVGTSENNFIQDNIACWDVDTGFYCSGLTVTIGNENQFGGTVTSCDEWPVVGEDYTTC